MPAWLGVIGGVIGLVVFFGSVVVYLAGSKECNRRLTWMVG
jgi:hypothetical protein